MTRSIAHSVALPRAAARRRHVLPGFGLSLGFATTYLSLLVVIPLAGLVWKASGLGFGDFIDITTSDRAIAAYRLTLVASAVAALINGVFGTMLAWVLVRYPFPGRRVVDSLKKSAKSQDF